MAVSTFLRSVLGKRPKPTTPDRTPPEQSSTRTVVDPNFSGQNNEAAYYHHLFADSSSEPPTVPQKLVIEIVLNNLANKDHRSNAVPRLPMVIPKLLRSLRDPDSSAKDYVEIINKDPVMSAAVLKLANSVYFSPAGAYLGDIERATVKLGISGLRSVLSAAVMQPIIQRSSPYFSHTGQRLWQHSLNTAVACEVIGHARRHERFQVYLLGLVHDIGKITLFSELCKQYKLNGDKQPGHCAFTPIMMQHAAQLSHQVAKDWQLPDVICTALGEQVGIAPGKQVSEFGLLLYQANIACEAFSLTPKAKHEELDYLLDDFQLPRNLFHKLDQVSIQL